MDKFTNHEIGA